MFNDLKGEPKKFAHNSHIYHAASSSAGSCSPEASAAASASGSSAIVSGAAAAPFSFSAAPTCTSADKPSSSTQNYDAARTLDAGFFDPARDAGFLVVDAGFTDVLEGGFALAARDPGFAEPARDAFDAGLAAAALLAGLAAALEAGFAYATVSEGRREASRPKPRGRTFFAGGPSPLTAGAPSSASFSVAVRLRPFDDLGFSSPSAAGSLIFLDRGLAGAFLGAGSGLGCSLIRVERRGSAGASEVAVGLRGIVCECAGLVGGWGQRW